MVGTRLCLWASTFLTLSWAAWRDTAKPQLLSTRGVGGKKVVAYWEGYTEGDVKPYRLEEVPENIDYIPIAFIAPRPLEGEDANYASGWEFDQTFVYSKEEVVQGIQKINERNNGQKVLLSLLDSPTTHWDQVNLPKFAENIVKDAHDIGIKGFDIDIESGMAADKFAGKFSTLITELKKQIDENGYDMIITYVTMGSYYDEEILNSTAKHLEYITTMRYWDEQEDLFHRYGKIVGYDKVGVGVMTQTTTLDMVSDIAKYTNRYGSKLMMLWSLTRDVHECSNDHDGAWLSQIGSEFMELSSGEMLMQGEMSESAMYNRIAQYRPNMESIFIRAQRTCGYGPDSEEDRSSKGVEVN